MTKEKLISTFPLLPPSLVLAYHAEATQGGKTINDKDLFRIGVHEWLSHLGFIGDITIRDIVDCVYTGFSPDDAITIAIIDHKCVAIGAIGSFQLHLFMDITPGPNAGKIVQRNINEIAKDMETNFVLYTSAMMRRLRRSYYASEGPSQETGQTPESSRRKALSEEPHPQAGPQS